MSTQAPLQIVAARQGVDRRVPRRMQILFSAVLSGLMLILLGPLPSASATASGPCAKTDDSFFTCKSYSRGSNSYPLRVGWEYGEAGGGMGYFHVVKDRAWDLKMDSWIKATISLGAYERKDNDKDYFTLNPQGEPGCEYTVVLNLHKLKYEPVYRGIETTFGNGKCSLN